MSDDDPEKSVSGAVKSPSPPKASQSATSSSSRRAMEMTPAEAEESRCVLVEGFLDDPLQKVISPDDQIMPECLNAYVDFNFHFCLRTAERFRETDLPFSVVVKDVVDQKEMVVAAALCNPVPASSHFELIRVLIRCAVNRLGFKTGMKWVKRVFGAYDVTERLTDLAADFLSVPRDKKNDPKRMSVLEMIACHPSQVGKAYGSAALGFVLRHFDEMNIPVILISSNPRNLSFYRRLGFQLLGSETWRGAVMSVCARKVP